MGDLHQLLTVEVSNDGMTATLQCNENKILDLKEYSITYHQLKDFIQENNVVFGILEKKVQHVVHHFTSSTFPITIAEGKKKRDGQNGKIHYVFNMNTEVDRSQQWDFRDVMRLPVVRRGEKIATNSPPTKGIDGTSVYGKKIRSKDGKPAYMKAGVNVNFNQDEETFYAIADGLVNFGMNVINVYTVYEVNEDISMRTGNISFVGSIIIRGDVPSGFTIEASGDIKIYGIVEAATVKAGGSIYISEGIAGLKTGNMEAEEDIYVGYMNQANAQAGRSIHVEQSILHSNCSAAYDITCRHGNIIGGTLFAGYTIEAKNIGNRMNTPTKLSIGIDHHLYKEQVNLEKQRDQLRDNMKKMDIIKQKLDAQGQLNDSKTKITLLKLQPSYNKSREDLKEVKSALRKMDTEKDGLDYTDLKVFGTIFTNTVVAFGKYRRTMDRNYDRVIVKLEENDIIIKSNVL